MKLVRLVAIAVAVAAACACHSSSAFERGRESARANEWEEALRYYERAVAEKPDNVEYRIALERARLAASRAHLAQARARVDADDLKAAIDHLEVALGYDPSNRYAVEQLEALRVRVAEHEPASVVRASRLDPFVSGEPVLDASSPERLHVKFPEGSSLRTVLESLAKLAGVNILFDESFRDQPIGVDLDDVTYREALDILTQTNGLFYKVLNSSVVVLGEN